MPAAQVDLYGSTEAGYLFVGDAFQDNSRVIDGNAFVELVPWRGLPDVFQTQVTTRHRRAMPLLRYNTGDIVRRFPDGYRILGRERDLYLRPDGVLVSADDIDAALPADFTCWHASSRRPRRVGISTTWAIIMRRRASWKRSPACWATECG